MESKFGSYMMACLLLASFFLLLPFGLNAQSTNGVILGTVTDPSGRSSRRDSAGQERWHRRDPHGHNQ